MLLELHSLAGGTVDEHSKLGPPLTRLHPFSLLPLCSALFACAGAAEIPDIPDLAILQDQYNHPTAELDATTAVTALNEMPSLSELAAGFRAAGYIQSGVEQGGSQGAQGTSSRLRVQGSINVNVRCPGDAFQPAYGANGTVDLTIAVEKNQIKRTIGGQATRCILRGNLLAQDVRVELDGPLAIDFGKDIGLRNRGAEQLLMNIRGALKIGDYEVKNLSARWTEESLQYLFVMSKDEWVVAEITTDGTVSITDKSSIWGCSDGQTCSKL